MPSLPLRARPRALAALVVGLLVLPSAASAEQLFTNPTPATTNNDTAISGPGINVGVRFSASIGGTLTQVRYYQATAAAGVDQVSIYTGAGGLLKRQAVTGAGAVGWQTVALPTAKQVTVTAGATYVVAVHNTSGDYPATSGGFSTPVVNKHLTGTAGTYAYGPSSAYPSSSYGASNYFVDLTFVPGPSQLVPPDGAGTYGRFTANTVSGASTFFPIGVWEEQYARGANVASHGINTIVNPQGTVQALPAGVGTVGAIDDEADMWAGPGSGAWTGLHPGQGQVCASAETAQDCGFSVMAQESAGTPATTMRYANYGKGVAFWESDANAATFVNSFQDLVSDDLYWGTDRDLCGAYQGAVLRGQGGTALTDDQCHRASNYGLTLDRVRSLVSPAASKPVWTFVEVGAPSADIPANPGNPNAVPPIPATSAVPALEIPVPMIKAAAWSSLIHGARGIVWFNHSFGGSCQSQHVLDDCRASAATAVNAIDAQITSLAPQLNSPSVTGPLTTGSIDQTTRWDGSHLYVFTGSTAGAATSTTGSWSLPCVGDATATPIGESRAARTVTGGTFTDTWSTGNVVHLYRIDGGSTCGF